MRRTLTGVAVLLLGLATANSVQAQHPLTHGTASDCGSSAKGHRLWPFSGHKLFGHGNACDEAPKGHHRLWPFSGHKLFNHGCGHTGCGHAGCGFGGCANHPWFNTFKGCPDGAFPIHPFARSPRDFFMYEW